MSSLGMAAQLTLMNGLSLRDEWAWSARATSSFPVPLSPVRRTVVGVSATRSSTAYRSAIPVEVPMIPKRAPGATCRALTSSPASCAS